MTKNLILTLILACLARIWALNFYSWVLHLLDVRHCCKLSLYTISRKTYGQNSRKWQKISYWAWFRPIELKFTLQFFSFFFSKIWLSHTLDIMVSYYNVKYQKKLMIQSWENLVADRQTDRQTDQSDVIGCCPTNVMRPLCSMEKIAKIMKQTYAYKCYASTHSV